MSDTWPFPHQNAAPPEVVHAVGQLIMNWNYAEYGLQRLSRKVFDVNGAYSTALLAHVGTGTMVDGIRAVFPIRGLHADTVEHISKALDWFLILRAERNVYAHSIYHPTLDKKGLRQIGATSKGGKMKFKENRLSLQTVRELAEEIYDLAAYLIAASEQMEKTPPHDPATRKFAPRDKSRFQFPVLRASP